MPGTFATKKENLLCGMEDHPVHVTTTEGRKKKVHRTSKGSFICRKPNCVCWLRTKKKAIKCRDGPIGIDILKNIFIELRSALRGCLSISKYLNHLQIIKYW